jgi:hypothetical protein
MISDAERNYEPRDWTPVETLPSNRDGLLPAQLFYFCNSDSVRFADFITRDRGDKAVLLDYEIYSVGLEPDCGSAIEVNDTHVFLTVYTSEGNKHFQAPRAQFEQLPFFD